MIGHGKSGSWLDLVMLKTFPTSVPVWFYAISLWCRLLVLPGVGLQLYNLNELLAWFSMCPCSVLHPSPFGYVAMGCLGTGSEGHCSAVAAPLPVPHRKVTLSGQTALPMTTTTGMAASLMTASTPSQRRRTVYRCGTGPAAVSTAVQGHTESYLHANKFCLLLLVLF